MPSSNALIGRGCRPETRARLIDVRRCEPSRQGWLKRLRDRLRAGVSAARRRGRKPRGLVRELNRLVLDWRDTPGGIAAGWVSVREYTLNRFGADHRELTSSADSSLRIELHEGPPLGGPSASWTPEAGFEPASSEMDSSLLCQLSYSGVMHGVSRGSLRGTRRSCRHALREHAVRRKPVALRQRAAMTPEVAVCSAWTVGDLLR